MDLTANICACCCMVHTKDILNKLTRSQEEFLHQFLCQESVTKLSIWSTCKIKLDNLQQFCGQIKGNIQMLKMIKVSRQKTRKGLLNQNLVVHQREKEMAPKILLRIDKSHRKCLLEEKYP